MIEKTQTPHHRKNAALPYQSHNLIKHCRPSSDTRFSKSWEWVLISICPTTETHWNHFTQYAINHSKPLCESTDKDIANYVQNQKPYFDGCSGFIHSFLMFDFV